MTMPELKDAFQRAVPVECQGIRYDYISAVVWRRHEGLYIEAELMDKNGNSVTVARPDRVQVVGVEKLPEDFRHYTDLPQPAEGDVPHE